MTPPQTTPPAEAMHDWIEDKRHGREAYHCPACDCWTANLPLYRHEVCPAKDRRKGRDRRQSK